MQPKVHSVFSWSTKSYQYLIADPASKHAVIVDAVLGTTSPFSLQAPSTAAADELLALVYQHDYTIDFILHTSALAAPSTAAWFLRAQLRESGQESKVCGAKGLEGVKERVARNTRAGVAPAWDDIVERDLDEGEAFNVGGMKLSAMKLPGIAKEHQGFWVGDDLLVGELPGLRSTPCPDPNVAATRAGMEWLSMRRLLALPDVTRIFYSSSSTRRAGDSQDSATMTVAQYRGQLGNLARASERDFVAQMGPKIPRSRPEKQRRSLWENVRGLVRLSSGQSGANL